MSFKSHLIYLILEKDLYFYRYPSKIEYTRDSYDLKITKDLVISKIERDLKIRKIDTKEFKFWDETIRIKFLIEKLKLIFKDCKSGKISIRIGDINDFKIDCYDDQSANKILVWNDGIGFGLNLCRQEFEDLLLYYELLIAS